MRSGVKSTGIVALVASGVTAAFSLASCCAIPILLVGTGIGTSWLAPLVAVSQPYAELLTGFSVVALGGGVAGALRAPTFCEPAALCARPIFRWTMIGVASGGAILLALSKIYA